MEALWALAMDYPSMAIPSFACFFALVLWRSWRFSISPLFYPNDPKELPYWIPGIGHTFSFFSNSQELLSNGRKYFGNTREPFTITVAASQIHILIEPNDVAVAYKNSSTLSFDGFVQVMMRTFGSSEYCVRAMYNHIPHSPQENDFPNPQYKSLAKLTRDMHIRQLHQGEHLDDLGNKFGTFLHKALVLEEVAEKHYATQKTPESIVVPLLMWSSEIFVLGGQRAYFGPLLEEIDPNMVQTFLQFDELGWQVMFQYPRFASRRMHVLLQKLIEDLEKYYETPADKRKGDAWFTKAFEHEARRAGIKSHDIATMMFTVYWGINSNTRYACFWMLAYLVHHPNLMEAVRTETALAFDDSGHVNFHYLNDSCPQLAAIWDETIRITAASASIRYITANTVIGGKTLRKRNRVMIPIRQLHFNEEVFGKNIHQFDSHRFAKNKAALKGSSWRPFGGGTTICPGRFFARQSVLTEVAMLLQRFDVELAEPGPFPRFDEGKPVLGIVSIKKGDDPLVRLRKRNTFF